MSKGQICKVIKDETNERLKEKKKKVYRMIQSGVLPSGFAPFLASKPQRQLTHKSLELRFNYFPFSEMTSIFLP